MKQYVKNNDGCLIETAKTSIKTYETAQDVCDAITAGTLLEGEQWQIKTNEGIHTDTVDSVNYLLSVTPGTATPQNMLVTQDQLNDAADLTTVCARICQNEQDIASLGSSKASCSDFNPLAARVGVNETNIGTLQTDITSKVTCTDYTTCVSNIDTAVSCRVCCCDLTTTVSTINDAIACRVCCSDLVTELGSKVTCTDYTTCVGAIDNCISGLETRVCTNEDNIACHCTDIGNLQSCPGLDCIGNVVGLINNGTTITPGADGKVTLNTPVYTLSGNTLTITF